MNTDGSGAVLETWWSDGVSSAIDYPSGTPLSQLFTALEDWESVWVSLGQQAVSSAAPTGSVGVLSASSVASRMENLLSLSTAGSRSSPEEWEKAMREHLPRMLTALQQAKSIGSVAPAGKQEPSDEALCSSSSSSSNDMCITLVHSCHKMFGSDAIRQWGCLRDIPHTEDDVEAVSQLLIERLSLRMLQYFADVDTAEMQQLKLGYEEEGEGDAALPEEAAEQQRQQMRMRVEVQKLQQQEEEEGVNEDAMKPHVSPRVSLSSEVLAVGAKMGSVFVESLRVSSRSASTDTQDTASVNKISRLSSSLCFFSALCSHLLSKQQPNTARTGAAHAWLQLLSKRCIATILFEIVGGWPSHAIMTNHLCGFLRTVRRVSSTSSSSEGDDEDSHRFQPAVLAAMVKCVSDSLVCEWWVQQWKRLGVALLPVVSSLFVNDDGQEQPILSHVGTSLPKLRAELVLWYGLLGSDPAGVLLCVTMVTDVAYRFFPSSVRCHGVERVEPFTREIYDRSRLGTTFIQQCHRVGLRLSQQLLTAAEEQPFQWISKTPLERYRPLAIALFVCPGHTMESLLLQCRSPRRTADRSVTPAPPTLSLEQVVQHEQRCSCVVTDQRARSTIRGLGYLEQKPQLEPVTGGEPTVPSDHTFVTSVFYPRYTALMHILTRCKEAIIAWVAEHQQDDSQSTAAAILRFFTVTLQRASRNHFAKRLDCCYSVAISELWSFKCAFTQRGKDAVDEKLWWVYEALVCKSASSGNSNGSGCEDEVGVGQQEKALASPVHTLSPLDKCVEELHLGAVRHRQLGFLAALLPSLRAAGVDNSVVEGYDDVMFASRSGVRISSSVLFFKELPLAGFCAMQHSVGLDGQSLPLPLSVHLCDSAVSWWVESMFAHPATVAARLLTELLVIAGSITAQRLLVISSAAHFPRFASPSVLELDVLSAVFTGWWRLCQEKEPLLKHSSSHPTILDQVNTARGNVIQGILRRLCLLKTQENHAEEVNGNEELAGDAKEGHSLSAPPTIEATLPSFAGSEETCSVSGFFLHLARVVVATTVTSPTKPTPLRSEPFAWTLWLRQLSYEDVATNATVYSEQVKLWARTCSLEYRALNSKFLFERRKELCLHGEHKASVEERSQHIQRMREALQQDRERLEAAAAAAEEPGTNLENSVNSSSTTTTTQHFMAEVVVVTSMLSLLSGVDAAAAGAGLRLLLLEVIDPEQPLQQWLPAKVVLEHVGKLAFQLCRQLGGGYTMMESTGAVILLRMVYEALGELLSQVPAADTERRQGIQRRQQYILQDLLAALKALAALDSQRGDAMLRMIAKQFAGHFHRQVGFEAIMQLLRHRKATPHSSATLRELKQLGIEPPPASAMVAPPSSSVLSGSQNNSGGSSVRPRVSGVATNTGATSSGGHAKRERSTSRDRSHEPPKRKSHRGGHRHRHRIP